MEKDISIFIENQFPKFVHEYGPKMVLFIKKYYEWLETVDNTLDTSRKLQEYIDVDTSPDKFWFFLKNEFMQGVPENHSAKKELLLKKVKDLYAAKGTEKSFDLIFRILFNEDIEFYYPSKDILRVSDGKWLIEKSLIVQPKAGVDVFSFLGKELKGATSKAKARAERIIAYTLSGVITYEIYLSNIFNDFTVEKIYDSQDNIEIGNCIEYRVYNGRYTNNDGFLSDDKYIQDSYYYQEYSYEIRSGQPTIKYDKIIKDTVHPSGTIMFGKFYLNRTIAIASTTKNKSVLELEFERNLPIPLSIFSNLALAGSGDFLDIFIDTFFEIFSDINSDVVRYFPKTGTVKILTDDSISTVASYTIDDLKNVTFEAITNKQVLIGNSTNFTVDFSNGNLEMFVDHINNSDMGFAKISTISSNVALTNTARYSFTDVPDWDYIYKGILEG